MGQERLFLDPWAVSRGFVSLRDKRALQGSWNRDLYPEEKCFIQISAQLCLL